MRTPLRDAGRAASWNLVVMNPLPRPTAMPVLATMGAGICTDLTLTYPPFFRPHERREISLPRCGRG